MDWKDFLASYRRQTAFDPEEWIHSKCILLDKYLETHCISGVVLSVSGGVDSSVTLALLKRTMDLPNSHLKKIVALSQPIHSSKWALERATEVCDALGIPLTIIDQSQIHTDLTNLFEKAMGTSGNEFSKGQLKSYLRTPANYFAAQLLTEQGFPAIVMGTGNMDEDGYLAYFCKYGDGAVDLQLIADLHKSQVFKVGTALRIPKSILEAAPSADLWDGQTDEEEMGFSYDFVEYYVGVYLKLSSDEQVIHKDMMTPESSEEFDRFESLCTKIHMRNAHKIGGVVNL